jgi:hypothetical protein
MVTVERGRPSSQHEALEFVSESGRFTLAPVRARCQETLDPAEPGFGAYPDTDREGTL